MISREKIAEEIEKVPNENLDELYQVIKEFGKQSTNGDANGNVVAKLRSITISGPSDFSTTAEIFNSDDKNAR